MIFIFMSRSSLFHGWERLWGFRPLAFCALVGGFSRQCLEMSSSSPRLRVLQPVDACEAAPSSLGIHCRSLRWIGPPVFHLTHICICMPFIDLPTSRGKRRLTEKMMLKRVKTGVERRVKTRMIRNLALQSALEPQSQVADQWVWEIAPWLLFLACVVNGQHKLHLFSLKLSTFLSIGGVPSYLTPLFL